MDTQSLPVIIIGAGPVGLAAAAHLLERGIEPQVLEAGDQPGDALRRWAQVRMFSPWEYNIDRAAEALLQRQGWQSPRAEAYPTGGELREHYLLPLAATPELRDRIHTRSRVLAISRLHCDRLKDAGRDTQPFLLRVLQQGREVDLLARAVIDASGSFDQPNPLGASGLPARGERGLADFIDYALPDVLGARRQRFAGQRVMVVGSGHSAFNVLSDLVTLQQQVPNTEIHWVIRGPSLAKVLGGGERDQLKERGRLGQRIAALVQSGAVRLHSGMAIDALRRSEQGIIASNAIHELPAVDRLVACTGFRPDLRSLAELRLGLDSAVEAPIALAPLINPNLHSCGTVSPHGAEQLAHPERDFYIVGMKSYGRAPTFLLRTGYEQVRSVAAALAGDWAAARRVDWVLPETGVCRSDFADESQAVGADCCRPSAWQASAVASCGDANSAAACATPAAPSAARVTSSHCCVAG